MCPKWLEKPLRWYLRLSFILSKQCNRHLARLYCSLFRDLKRIEVQHYLILSDRRYHRFESTIAKASITSSWKFSNTITLWFQFALSYCFDMFSLCFNNFLWHPGIFLSTGSSSVARASVTFFLTTQSLDIYIWWIFLFKHVDVE